jgi:cytochrome c-type biogenesis protein CcsB
VDKPFFEKLLGAVLAPLALFLNAFATFSLPQEMQLAGPLVPALQSNWLMMHVTVMIISYAALILGSLLSIVFVIAINLAAFGEKSKTTLRTVLPPLLSKAGKASKEYSNNKVFANLDYLSYRIIGIGFPFLTIGILSGAVWANEAWGSYWSWDPKETWALLTWLIFAIYLHTRLTKGWEGEKPALIASFGFIVVWVCYLGVNLLGEGLHSYGFFNT